MIDEAALPILIVDDYPTMLQIIRGLVRQAGFDNVEVVSSGGAALRILRERQFGLVIADWRMDAMTGLELLREMRGDVRLRDTPFIMISAESRPDHVAEAKAVGVNSYIVKPFNAVTLRTRMLSAMGG